MTLLERIRGPRDLDALSAEQLAGLAREIRGFLVEQVARAGGHLGSNLGVVELTIAVHRVFDSPRDAIVFDTGHQSYVHKLLTGRQDFSQLRARGGLAGYPQRAESAHDVVESSHASSSLSWADGLSRGFALRGEQDRHVVAVIGDGALTGGLAWEALNNLGVDAGRRVVIVLNDNGRSYDPTVGALARSLHRLRERPQWTAGTRVPEQPPTIFEELGIDYLGPVDGHELPALLAGLTEAKSRGRAVLVHAITEKGRGHPPAREDELDHLHTVRAAAQPARSGPSWTEVFGAELARLAEERPELVAITAAMLHPSGLGPLAQRHPQRVVDVGIAEQHAVAAAAGLARAGLHPVVPIYSTFLSRAVDQVLMDVALHRAGVTLVLDRAGITGPDGPSHHGMWDIALLAAVPGMRIAAPRDAVQLAAQLREAVEVADGPTALRFPRGTVPSPLPALRRLPDGAEVLWGEAATPSAPRDVLIVAVGALLESAVAAASLLAARAVRATVVDPRWIHPVPDSLLRLAASHRLVLSVEDGVRTGGFGSLLAQRLQDAGVRTPLRALGLPAGFLSHGDRDELLELAGLDARTIAADAEALLR